ncbi:hypothetical protein PF005_g15481 [Phytophthora fragariae]|uniref:RxLR effector protein n=1 Tax=Phytophthora fragariae TaxID=53985 RepID=A0A6A3XC83_9STRA|nr:hypothetical protein PF003_g18329 [Phytophthora fragariae]KAE8935623.1 hypothetical protein PF009_g14450 [Phytophthora fragariae]KAE9026820.1 hypothetical protein PF011_g2371 [Phytophthora fragariae]KAE9105729.1 hypothetical protein PF010_g12894 [Phytophthora fragariae]KAE9106382.1 hypothetical protein PF007_g13423 [Phytophthora fragariae]
MFKPGLILLFALSLLVSIDAIAAPAARSAVKLPALSGKSGKRSLRGFMTSDETATEERGTAEVTQKLKAMLSTSKLGQKLAALKQARIEKREAFVKKLLEDKADYKTLFKNKVTVEEVYNGLHISAADTLFGNPLLMSANLIKAKGYSRFVWRIEQRRRGF